MTPPTGALEIVVHRDPNSVAVAAATRLTDRLLELQHAGRIPNLVLTGGGTGIAVLDELRRGPARDSVDWSRIEFFWGDERFLEPGHSDRNETQARSALLAHVPVDPGRVHPMPAAEGPYVDDPERAARDYAAELAALTSSDDGGLVPRFDVCLLGVGEEGHVASVFPSSAAVYETAHSVVAVHNCPKPPPTRISLTLRAIRRSTEVWLITTGVAKAAALAMAAGGACEVEVPLAGAVGQARTLWLLDRAAAIELPGSSCHPLI